MLLRSSLIIKADMGHYLGQPLLHGTLGIAPALFRYLPPEATQVLAKDAFGAINNMAALICTGP